MHNPLWRVWTGVGRTAFRLLAAVGVVGLAISQAEAAPFTLGQPTVAVAGVPGYDELPRRIALTPTGAAESFDYAAVRVTETASWLDATFDVASRAVVLTFRTSGLVAAISQTTVRVSHGDNEHTLTVSVTAAPVNVVALADDPARNRMYALHRPETGPGAVLVFDPRTLAPLGAVSTAEAPADLDVSLDGAELAVIHPRVLTSASITVLDLETLAEHQTIPLPVFNYLSPDDPASARVAFGPTGTLYYVDSGWGPLLRVLRRSDGEVVQTFSAEAEVAQASESSHHYGLGDIVVDRARSAVFGWMRYGTGAGLSSSFAVRYDIGEHGRLTVAHTGEDVSPFPLQRDPQDTPAFVTADGATVIIKSRAFAAAAVDRPLGAYAGPVYAMSPGGELLVTAGEILSGATGDTLFTLPETATLRAVTSDGEHLVSFDVTERRLRTLDLATTLGDAVAGRATSPVRGTTVIPPGELRWTPVVGAERYHVYLATNAATAATATMDAPAYLGETSAAEWALATPPAVGATFYWRVDAITAGLRTPGVVRAFTTAGLAAEPAALAGETVRGHATLRAEVVLRTAAAGRAWTADSTASWVTLDTASGVTPVTLRVTLDASELEPGLHQALVRVTAGTDVLDLPVNLRVDPLAITRMEAGAGDGRVYALSEEGMSGYTAGERAYLLEIEPLRRAITRVLRVGRGATDLAPHAADGRVYVTNFHSGRLLAVDMHDFTLARSYTLSPWQAENYDSRDDLYRVSAGGPGRLVIEGSDQTVEISIFDTEGGVSLATTSESEGDGVYAPGGRYYYHGDNNISGAELTRYEMTGDRFTRLADKQEIGASYYGGRVVVVSADGSRVAWNGVVFNADLTVAAKPNTPVLALSGDGRHAFTSDGFYDVAGQRLAATFGHYARAVAQESATGVVVTATDSAIDYLTLPGAVWPGSPLAPTDGATVIDASALSWQAAPGATAYRVYLGDSAEAVAAAGLGAPQDRGVVSGSSFVFDAAPEAGRTYYWRVDTIWGSGAGATGEVHSFTVDTVAAGATELDSSAVAGCPEQAEELSVLAREGASWTVTSNRDWIQILNTTGTGPGTVRLVIDATGLTAGTHSASLTLGGGLATRTIPVRVQVHAFKPIRLRADPERPVVYALNEWREWWSIGRTTHLLALDAGNGALLRAVPLANGGSDLAVHVDDDRVYVAEPDRSWATSPQAGAIIAFARDDLSLAQRFAGFSLTGVHGQTAGRLAVAGPGRLIVRAEGYPSRVALFDTTSAVVLATITVNQGAEAADAAGGHYYFGEYGGWNSMLRRHAFTDLAWGDEESAGPGTDTYGWAPLVLCADGSRIFWNGAVFTADPFTRLWAYHGDVRTATSDGRFAFGPSAAYDVDGRFVVPLPGLAEEMVYHAGEDTLLWYAGGVMVARRVGHTRSLLPCEATVAEARAQHVVLRATEANLLRTVEARWRPTGETEWREPAVGSGMNWSEATLIGLVPETDYEFQLRSLGMAGVSEWSEVIAVRTRVSAPVLTLPERVTGYLGDPLSLTLPVAEGLSYEITGLPEGVTFDPLTGRLVGTPTMIGRYSVTIRAFNAGGEMTAGVTLETRSREALLKTASYGGLLGGEDGLIGRWVLTRTNLVYSAVVYSNRGIFKFSGRLQQTDDGRAVHSRELRVFGEWADVSLEWDLVTNRVRVDVASDYFSATTFEDSGAASSWHAKTRPYPGPGRYHVVLAPVSEEDDAWSGPQPEGRGYAVMTVGKDGATQITGVDATGRAITYSHRISDEHLLPVFTYNRRESHWGLIGHDAPELPGAEINGVLGWAVSDAYPTSQLYPAGFARVVRVVGSRYSPASNHAALAAGGTEFTLRLSGGGLERFGMETLSQSATLTTKALSAPPAGPVENPFAVRVKLDARTGAVSGEVVLVETHPSTGRPVKRRITYRGLAVPDIDGEGTFFAGGHFLLTDWLGDRHSGRVELVRAGETYVPEVDESFFEDIATPDIEMDGTIGGSTGSIGGSGDFGVSGSFEWTNAYEGSGALLEVGSVGSVSVSRSPDLSGAQR